MKLISGIALVLFFLISGTVFAQEDSLKMSVDMDTFFKQIKSEKIPPVASDFSDWTENPKVKSLYDSSLMAYYDFSIVQFQRANKVLAWQTTSGKIIFWIVVTIVMFGIILSGIQFYLSAKSNFDMPKSEINLSYKGIRLHSSVLGLLILIISIAFFYLYLNYVYPVSTLN